MENLHGVLIYQIAEYAEIKSIPALELFSTTL